MRHLLAALPFAAGAWLTGMIGLTGLIGLPAQAASPAPALRFQQLGIADGLSQNTVLAISQDHTGFIWLGTRDGLARYDGRHIRLFREQSERPTGLRGHTINELLVAQDGGLWVGTNAGLFRYDASTERFDAYHLADDSSRSRSFSILCLLQDRAGRLWAGNRHGLWRIDVARRLLQPEAATTGQRVAAMAETGTGELWLALPEVLARFRPDHFQSNQGQIERWPLAASAGAGDRRALLATGDGQLWLAGWQPGLLRFDRTRQRFEPVNLADSLAGADFGLSLAADPSGAIWLGTRYSGLLRYQPEQGRSQRYRSANQRPDALSGDSVTALFIDREALLWAGTEGDGVSFAASAGARFRLHGRFEPGLADDNVRAVYQDRDDSLWLGTPAGLYRLPGEPDQAARRYPLPASGVGAAGPPASPELGPADMVHALAARRAGGFWIGGEKGLFRYQPETDRVLPLRAELPALPVSHQTSIINLLEDRSGALWIGTYGGGVYRWRPASGELRRYTSDPTGDPAGDLADKPPADPAADPATGPATASGTNPDPRPVANANAAPATAPVPAPAGLSLGQFSYALFEDRRGQIWVGHENGVDRWQPELDRFDPVGVAEPGRPGLGYPVVQALAEDRAGRIWVGTQRGLTRMELDGNGRPVRFRQYDERSGLANTMIYGLLSSSDGRWLWISSNAGLAELDTATDAVRLFDARDGLQSNEFNGGATFRNGRGELFFGGVNGLTVFDPAALVPDPIAPTVVLTGLRRFDRTMPLRPALASRDRLALSYRDSVLSFELAALRFANAGKNRFAYQLTGLDPDWVELKGETEFTLRNLPAGRYTLKVRAANADGVWSEPRTLALAIAPPWWRSPWAYSGYGLLAVAAVLILLAWRTRALRRRALVLEQSVRERTGLIEQQKQALTEQAERMQQLLQLRERLFANISHEFRTPLTLILGPTEQLLGKASDPTSRAWLENIQRNGQRLLRMVEQLIQLARLQAGANPPQRWQPASAPVGAIAESFRQLAERHGLRFTACIDPELWLLALPDALEQIVLNLLSNACKYTANGGEVGLTLSHDGDQLLLTVSDTGIGIPAAEQAQLFQRFYRVETSQTEAIPGAGLGLALVKELVGSHAGELSLTSQPGQGTAVRVRLPGCRVGPPADAPGNGAAPPPPAWPELTDEDLTASPPAGLPGQADEPDGNRPSLLIIEDNAELRRYLIQLLAADYRCLEAGDGETGLDLARHWLPDLILCDVSLPGRDGFALARLLRDDEACCHIPFVFLTAHADQDSRLRGLRELADDYLSKPFDAAELKQRLANLLDLRALLQQRYRQRLLAQAGSHARADVSQPGALRPVETRPGETQPGETQPGETQVDETRPDQSTDPTPALAEKDQRLLDRLLLMLAQRHPEPELNLAAMAAALAMSERQLQRKLQALLNLSPMEYLKRYRLERAAELLRTGQPAGRVSDAVGFSSAAYFSRCFKAHFGVAPGQYRR